MGFEPTNELPRCRFSRPENDPRNDEDYQELRDDASGEVPSVVPCPLAADFGTVFPTDLGRMIAAWDRLPAAIQAGVLAVVGSAVSDSDLEGRDRPNY